MTKSVEVNVNDLTGMALDWAVAEADGLRPYLHKGEFWVLDGKTNMPRPRFSTDWAQGGPLLDEYSWSLPYRAIARHHLGKFESCTPGGFPHNGDTPLIAACRAIVAAALGNVVRVPAVLVGVAA